MECLPDRKSTRLNSSHTVIYTLSLHDALPIFGVNPFITTLGTMVLVRGLVYLITGGAPVGDDGMPSRSEEHTSELQSHRDLHSFPTRRSSDLRRQSVHHHARHNGPGARLGLSDHRRRAGRRRWNAF